MKQEPFASTKTLLKIPFHDVDTAEVAWHGHYIKYLEIARCELLDSIDYNYAAMRDSGFYWPVIDLRVKYVRPARFGQVIEVQAKLIEWENRMKVEYRIVDADSGTKLTTGYTSQVAVRISDGEMLLASPPVLARKLGLAAS